MATRTDVTVDFNKSPRIITVAAPSTEITIQDLVDTCRDIEDEIRHMDEPHLIDAAGKEDLGGGVLVGITAELQNARLGFESRPTPTTEGTVTTTNAAGTALIDTSATFSTSGVLPGAHVVNHTTFESATVIAVTSETELETEPVAGGSPDGWTSGDTYTVHNVIQCNISGGNLVAIDENDIAIDPVFPTAWTQIVRASSSSATLQELGAIQFSSFNGGVTVDTTNSSGLAASGTTFPIGTAQQPVDNFTDALSIASSRGFDTFFILGDATIDAGLSYNGIAFQGDSENKTTLTISASADVTNSEFFFATVQGTLDGGNLFRNCRVKDINFVDGFIQSCVLDGTVTLSGVETAHFLDCFSGVPGVSTPTIDMAGSGSPLAIRNYNGGITLRNKTGNEQVSVDMASGQLILESTITNGVIVCRGVGKLVNNATTTGSPAAIVINEMIEAAELKATAAITRNKVITDPTTGIMTVYDTDDVTVLYTGQMYEDAAGSQTYRGQGAERRERLT